MRGKETLEIELRRRDIPYIAQQEMRVLYKGEQLKHRYIADLVCYDCVLLELKAVEKLVPVFEAQVLNYLSLSQIRVGILVNLGHSPGVEIRRLVK
ncbi:MAG: GxxExxY protein [Victivallales bacterium]|nr:GxxExxY protein [Victivallales bacterium]